ncbi:hypothetical protein D3C84_927130 [compost metagenome]
MAELLARQVLITASDLREGPGHLWLSQGVAGAIGLQCVGEVDGPEARAVLVQLKAEDLARALGSDGEPIGTLSEARAQGWAAFYAPLLSLDWVASQSAADLSALSVDLRNGQAWPQTVQDMFGAPSDEVVAQALKRWGTQP